MNLLLFAVVSHGSPWFLRGNVYSSGVDAGGFGFDFAMGRMFGSGSFRTLLRLLLFEK